MSSPEVGDCSNYLLSGLSNTSMRAVAAVSAINQSPTRCLEKTSLFFTTSSHNNGRCMSRMYLWPLWHDLLPNGLGKCTHWNNMAANRADGNVTRLCIGNPPIYHFVYVALSIADVYYQDYQRPYLFG